MIALHLFMGIFLTLAAFDSMLWVREAKETNPAKQIAVMLFTDWRENRNALIAHNAMYPNSLLEIPADLVLANSERLYKKAYKLFKDSLC